ncbi:MAG: chromosome segregation protein SMC [Proteobacteria bacterium]|nr:chromosome segregation protein SMC [Pseudomonadota bacterium]
MQFLKFRLSGFKSFVDPTEVRIDAGLTGIVGPNGCGKSNLVEALSWVMGELSAKKLRGSEMDDVIFGGTADRPARNIAEVSLLLDNSDRMAPAAFNDQDEIEVTRQIERGCGSTYRINGAEVRARDVQLLFADAATGSGSTALVSQGQVGALINARPTDRRGLLEEAAGITGLHSRRHEAELRLRAADNNLERLEDVVAALEAQLEGLKRQARQATRYRNLSDHVRRAEATLFHVRWSEAAGTLDTAAAALESAKAVVEKLTRRAGRGATVQAGAAAKLPQLRASEAEAAAKLQRFRLAREALDSEEARIHEVQENCQRRLLQIGADIEREEARASDAAEAVARLHKESAGLNRSRDEQDSAEREAKAALFAANTALAALEGRLSELTEQVAAAEARRIDADGRIAELEARRARLNDAVGESAKERAAIEAEASDGDALLAAEAGVNEAADRLVADRAEADGAEQARIDAQQAEEETREEWRSREADAARLRAEDTALKQLLVVEDTDPWPPLIDSLTVSPGYETALGAALGDDLSAPDDPAAPAHWRALEPFDAPPRLPAGARPLSDFVKAPKALARRLSQTGVVEKESDGQALRDALVQGQRLVSRDGALWRWDGYTVGAGTAIAAAIRLGQRNRLRELKDELDRAESRVGDAKTKCDDARAMTEGAARRERELRAATRDAEARLHTAREEHASLAQQAAAAASKLTALDNTLELLRADNAETEAEIASARETQRSLGDAEAARQQVAGLRADLGVLRADAAEKQRADDLLMQENERRNLRLADIAMERESWQARADNARRQIEELGARKSVAEKELDGLASRPEQITAERHALADKIDEFESLRRTAADALAAGETALADADRTLRDAETALADAREEMVRNEGALSQARQSLESLSERIAERLECKPEALAEIANLKPGELPEQGVLETRLERLLRERENMGPVNLRAETEAKDLAEQISTMRTEREDLIQAIARLRRGINELNREARERFLGAFETVNEHFADMFKRLFGGGRAHLSLTESDDPLEAGIEIMASPPGKRLQVLSLLSGGEQALTTIALLFAVFMTNPAPICVLDEVDAPLDDANVGRFCTLVEEIAHGTATRFLLVTHNHATMARMDRLYGVTMSERGVSQLVSVDLQGTRPLRAIA